MPSDCHQAAVYSWNHNIKSGDRGLQFCNMYVAIQSFSDDGFEFRTYRYKMRLGGIAKLESRDEPRNERSLSLAATRIRGL